MKKYILLVFLIFIALLSTVFFVYIKKSNSPIVTSINIPDMFSFHEEPSATEVQPSPILKDSYKISWIVVNDPNKIYLYSNLEDKLNSKDFATKYSCVNLVSGGFYDKNDKHIGLFITNFNQINDELEDDTFNGFLSISDKGEAYITEYPVFSPRISIQAGPIIMKDGIKINMTNTSDENARRIVAGINKYNNLIFISVYVDSNNFSGPKLSELPSIIENFSIEKNLNIQVAINLDGGVHSSMISSTNNISEASTVGSFFCIEP